MNLSDKIRKLTTENERLLELCKIKDGIIRKGRKDFDKLKDCLEPYSNDDNWNVEDNSTPVYLGDHTLAGKCFEELGLVSK